MENSLDAAESIGVLPEVHIELREISHATYRAMHGMESSKRKTAEPEPAPAGEDGVEVGEKGAKKKAPSSKKISGKDQSFFQLKVTDNGAGMPHNEIPKMFGTVLSGTKYGVRQERGKFGLGSKMVLIWSKMSTGLPMEIRSSQGSTKPITYVKLDLDLHSNSPNVHAHDKQPNEHKWRGSQINVTIGGEFSKFKRYTLNYLREMAVITPYARFEMHYIAEDPSKSFHIVHARRSENMPPPPQKAKLHPAAINNQNMENMLHHTSQKTLLKFLSTELDRVDKKKAQELIESFGPGFEEDMDPTALDVSKIRKMVDKIQQEEFDKPSGSELSPAGEYNLHLGIMKEMRPDMIATNTAEVQEVGGHPVLVEAAVSLGGRRAKEGISVHRFANRIPMLFQPGNDVSYKTANQRIQWKSYRMDKNNQKIGVYVSVVSTKIPYGGPNKEYIGDEDESLQKAVRESIMKCCIQLKARLVRSEALRQQKDRQESLRKYIPHVARSLQGLLESIVADGATRTSDPTLNKVLAAHGHGQVTEAILQQRLRTYIEEADMEQAMAGAQFDEANVVREEVYIPMLTTARKFEREMHSNVAVLKLATTKTV